MSKKVLYFPLNKVEQIKEILQNCTYAPNVSKCTFHHCIKSTYMLLIRFRWKKFSRRAPQNTAEER